MPGIERLKEVVTRLRGPDGCAWDKRQTPETLAPHLLEETHELVAAMRAGDASALRAELGDLTFVIVLLARLLEEEDGTTLDAIAASAAEKMIARHPHVFGDAEEPPNWEAQKLKDDPQRASRLDGVPGTLPALLRAQRISQRAASLGFDWPNVAGVRAKVDEELAELDEVSDGPLDRQREEFGDLLFTMANWGRKLGLSTEDALHAATHKFERRFRALEAELAAMHGEDHTPDLEELDQLWESVKGKETSCSG